MKVVVLGSYAPSLINFRGQLIEDIIDAGHSVIGCAPGHDPAVATALARLGATFQPVPLQRTGFNPFLDAGSLLNLAGVLRRLRPDLLFAYTSKPVIYGTMAARLAGVPRVYALISGLGYAFTGSGDLARRMTRRLTGALYRAALRAAEGVFFQNPDDLDEFRRHAIVSERGNVFLVNGSGVDVTHYGFSPPLLDPPTFLLIARLLRDKGIYEFVEAARALRPRYPQARFRLLGPVDSHPAAVPAADLAAWRAEGVIEYLPETGDVRPHLAQSTAYVLPSYREGMPRTVLEAMSTGRAIITTDAPGCRETVRAGENGFLVPVGDAHALAEAMERLIVEPELARSLGERSRTIAEERFDVRRVNAEMLRAMGLT